MVAWSAPDDDVQASLRLYVWGLPLYQEACGSCGRTLMGMRCHQRSAWCKCILNKAYFTQLVADSVSGPCALHCRQLQA